MLLLLSSGKHSNCQRGGYGLSRHISGSTVAVAFLYNYAVMSTTYTTGSMLKENPLLHLFKAA
jgi:hypothetical protein